MASSSLMHHDEEEQIAILGNGSAPGNFEISTAPAPQGTVANTCSAAAGPRLQRGGVVVPTVLGMLLVAMVLLIALTRKADLAPAAKRVLPTIASDDVSTREMTIVDDSDDTALQKLSLDSSTRGVGIQVALKGVRGLFCGDGPHGLKCNLHYVDIGSTLELVLSGANSTWLALRNPVTNMFCANKGTWVGCDLSHADGVAAAAVRLHHVGDGKVAIWLGSGFCSDRVGVPMYGQFVCNKKEAGTLETFELLILKVPDNLAGASFPVALRSEASGGAFCTVTHAGDSVVSCDHEAIDPSSGLSLLDGHGAWGRFTLQSVSSGKYCSGVGAVACTDDGIGPTTGFKLQDVGNRYGVFGLKGQGEMSKYCADVRGELVCDRFSASGSGSFRLTLLGGPQWSSRASSSITGNSSRELIFKSIYDARSKEQYWNQIYASSMDGTDNYLPGLKALAASLLDAQATRPLVVFTTDEPSPNLLKASQCLNFTLIQRPDLLSRANVGGGSTSFGKLNAWTLRAQKVVYLDPDAVVLRNLDELFEDGPDFRAAPDANSGHAWTSFSSGVMVLTPSMDVYEGMWATAVDSNETSEQDFLNRYFQSQWFGDAVLAVRFNTQQNAEVENDFDMAAVSVIRNSGSKPWVDDSGEGYPQSHKAFWNAFVSFQSRCEETSTLVALRSRRSGKICAVGVGGISCTSGEVTQEAVLALVQADIGENKKVLLRSDRTGLYCNSYSDILRCAFDVAHAGVFELLDKDWGFFSLRLTSGRAKYCSDVDGKIACSIDTADQWDTFEVVLVKAGPGGPASPVALKSVRRGTYWGSDQGVVRCNQLQVGIDLPTRFSLAAAGQGKHEVTIKSYATDRFCADMSDGFLCSYVQPAAFNLEPVGYGKFSFQNVASKQYCSDVGFGPMRRIRCNRGFAAEWEFFEIILAGLPGSRESRTSDATSLNSRLSLYNAAAFGLGEASVADFDVVSMKYNVYTTDRVLRLPDLALREQVGPEHVRWNNMCVDKVLLDGDVVASHVCPSYLYAKDLESTTELPDDVRSITESVLSNLWSNFSRSSFRLENGGTEIDISHYFLKAWEVFRRLKHIVAEDVFAFSESWNEDDTEILQRLDNHSGAWLEGAMTTDGFSKLLPGVGEFRSATFVGGNVAIISAAGNFTNQIENHAEIFYDYFVQSPDFNRGDGVKSTVHETGLIVVPAKNTTNSDTSNLAQDGVIKFDVRVREPWTAYCSRYHHDCNPDGTNALVLTMRPTAICSLGDSLAGFSRGFLFWWFVGRRFWQVDLYGVKSGADVLVESANEEELAMRAFEYHFYKEWSRLDGHTIIRS